jgi:DNA (cytosine-5)-methyltransferase 1
MFPATVEVVRRLQPRAFIVENVKGLTRSTFANYYQYILLQLSYPEIGRKREEDWSEHFTRLQVEKSSDRRAGKKALTYNVVPTLVNAADYGIPQKRERVFIVGFRSDLGVKWSFPRPTHSLDALLYDQFVTGAYWDRHNVAKSNRPAVPEKFEARVRKLETQPTPSSLPWRTVRDALMGLPDPQSRAAARFPDHRYQAGAKVYPGHTGSPLDLPAKTLKAGDHGVPGGENMLVNPDGSVRYFTVREAARIQTFPDGFRFHGSWTETMRQLGNAVPVMLGRIVASSVAERLLIDRMQELSVATAKNERAA